MLRYAVLRYAVLSFTDLLLLFSLTSVLFFSFTQGKMTIKRFFLLLSAICNGECGSKHPHSQIYDEAEATFTITG